MIIEAHLINYLTSQTLSVGSNIYAERPSELPPAYLVIEKTGSDTENMITTSTVAIQSCVDSMQGGELLDAMALNEEVKAAMAGYQAESDIVLVALNSDYNYTDDSTKVYRYQAIYQITHY